MRRAQQRLFYRTPARSSDIDKVASEQQSALTQATDLPVYNKENEGNAKQEVRLKIPLGISQQLLKIGERINIPYFDILDFLVEFDIPCVDLHNFGVISTKNHNVRHNLHPLGNGHSCSVIQHVTTRDISLNMGKVLESDTLVALKQFQVANDKEGPMDEIAGRRKTCQSILRELKMLSIPRLRAHENICQLLFVSWLGDSPIPALALELADFGSLEEILVAEGCGLSFPQKMHITVDIALGLAAIHACGFMHGDLKPANVVLFQHEVRQVVAKITDFGGSDVAPSCNTEDAQGGPLLATPAWCAPEVAYLDHVVDWQKADSYSYGLIVASVWSRPEQFLGPRSSSCILDFMLELNLDTEEERDLFLLMKSQPDTSEHSVTQLCCQWIRCHDESVFQLLRNIICETLHRDAAERNSIECILSTHIQGLSDRSSISLPPRLYIEDPISDHLLTTGNRDCSISTTCATDDVPQVPQHRRFKVWGETYSQRSESFHKLWFDMAVTELQGFECILSLPTLEMPEACGPAMESMTADAFLAMLVSTLTRHAEKIEEMHGVVVRHLSRLALLVAHCYYHRLGTLPDEAASLKWLQVAALSGNCNALAMVSIVHGSSVSKEHDIGIGEVLAAAGILIGPGRYASAVGGKGLQILKERSPSMYRQITNVIQWRETPQLTSSRYGIDSVRAWLAAEPILQGPLTMRRALTHGNVALARFLLDSDEDFTLVGENGFGLMYYLIFLEDNDAADLAPHLFSRGAKLDLPCRMTSDDPVDGSVLCCAIRRGMIQLVFAILSLHEEHDVPILHDHMVLSTAAIMHDPRTLYAMWTLAERKPYLSPCIARLRSRKQSTQLDREGILSYEEFCAALNYDTIHEKLDYDDLLHVVMTETSPVVICRISSNMEYATLAKRVMVGLLLNLRATFRQVPQLHQDLALKHALEQDDVTVLNHLLNATRLSGQNLDGILQLAIVNNALMCFRVIAHHTDGNPDLLDALRPQHNDMTALQVAVRHPDVRFTKTLLHHGADPTHEYLRPTSGVLWSALARALISGRTANAEELYQHYSMQQRDSLLQSQCTDATFVAQILQQWIVKRDPLLLESLQWVASKNAAFFYFIDGTGDSIPAWYILFHTPMALRQSDRLLDKQMMKLLVKIFPRCSNRLEQGFAPIHFATMFGQLEIVEVLVADGADVCIETSPHSSVFGGKTAFDLCVSRYDRVPPKILRAGSVAEKLWKLRLRALLGYLYSAGATSGSMSSPYEYSMWLSMSLQNTHASTTSTQSSKNTDFGWPLPLPRDPSSSAVDDGEKVVVRLPDESQVTVNRGPAMGLFPPEAAGKLGRPSETFIAWLKSEVARHRRGHHASQWADVNVRWHDSQVNMRSAVKVRGCHYEYPEIDLSREGGNYVVSLIDNISNPSNRRHLQDVEAVLRQMRYTRTPGNERYSNWKFAGT